jgi:putative flippase GtrA
VKQLSHFLFVRHRHNWILLFRFGMVGGTGVLVNLATIILCKELFGHSNGVAIDLPGTEFNVRWYHVYSTVAFLVANLWNFQLNRSWTFRSAGHAGWFSEYKPFLAVGLLGQAVGLLLLTAFMHPDSLLSLSSSVFDDSSILRTRLYWAQLLTIVITTPMTFVFNKLWTFSSVRGV